jgi:hypothetical protein
MELFENGVELHSTDSRRRLSPQELVAAGVVLRGYQHKASTSRNWLRLRWMAERAQDTEHGDVGGEDAEADGGDHGEAEDKGHQERNHGRKSFWVMSEASHFV